MANQLYRLSSHQPTPHQQTHTSCRVTNGNLTDKTSPTHTSPTNIQMIVANQRVSHLRGVPQTPWPRYGSYSRCYYRASVPLPHRKTDTIIFCWRNVTCNAAPAYIANSKRTLTWVCNEAGKLLLWVVLRRRKQGA